LHNVFWRAECPSPPLLLCCLTFLFLLELFFATLHAMQFFELFFSLGNRFLCDLVLLVPDPFHGSSWSPVLLVADERLQPRHLYVRGSRFRQRLFWPHNVVFEVPDVVDPSSKFTRCGFFPPPLLLPLELLLFSFWNQAPILERATVPFFLMFQFPAPMIQLRFTHYPLRPLHYRWTLQMFFLFCSVLRMVFQPPGAPLYIFLMFQIPSGSTLNMHGR